jgi:hypothetical protein
VLPVLARDLITSISDQYSPAVGQAAVPFAVAPLEAGGIYIEWRKAGAQLGIEIGPHNDFGFLLVERKADGTRETRESEDASWSEVLELVRQVVLS